MRKVKTTLKQVLRLFVLFYFLFCRFAYQKIVKMYLSWDITLHAALQHIAATNVHLYSYYRLMRSELMHFN